MAFLLLFFSLALSVSAEDNQKTCYVCASEELRSRWQLTGLPRIGEQYFSTCSSTAQLPTKNKESCPGPCFTMVFDDPDFLDGTNPAQLFVRGCHTTLTQVASDRTSNTGSFCELDTSYPMSNSRGLPVKINMLVEFCSSADCNTRGRSYTEPACAQQTVNLLNNQPLPCYECTPKQGTNCNENRCAKKYCMKQTVWLGGGYQVTKTCSNVNVIGIDDYCMSYAVTATPGGVAVSNQYNQCFCKNKPWCNGGNAIFRMTYLIISLFVFNSQ